MAMKNSMCRCRVLAKIATSQPTTRRIPPSITLLLQQSSCYSTDKKEHSPPTTTPKNTPPLYKKSPSSTDFPRPKEIPFQAKVANSINLIGYIDMPIQTLVSSHGGKFTAATVITQEPSYHSPALRIPIIFEGDLAHIAASHLKKGDFVKIGGQLSTDPPPFPEMQDQTQVLSGLLDSGILVLGNSINFVEGSFQMKKSLLEQQLEGPLDDDVSMKRNGESGSNSWTDLLENPDKWWDYRSSKLSGLVMIHPLGLKKVKFDVKTVLPTQIRQQKENNSYGNHQLLLSRVANGTMLMSLDVKKTFNSFSKSRTCFKWHWGTCLCSRKIGLEKVKFDVKTGLPAQIRQQKENNSYGNHQLLLSRVANGTMLRKDSGRTWWKTLINGGTTDLTRKTQNLPISSTKKLVKDCGLTHHQLGCSQSCRLQKVQRMLLAQRDTILYGDKEVHKSLLSPDQGVQVLQYHIYEEPENEKKLLAFNVLAAIYYWIMQSFFQSCYDLRSLHIPADSLSKLTWKTGFIKMACGKLVAVLPWLSILHIEQSRNELMMR
ncbi:hypothetical protein DKX38_025714 [Salix brachista]|uniref:Uncharacterized protein n=1 Tax=Salix brachista TaxID=2182728 RepID=A0A5N5JVR1_9ROSI|nr:hypothetical protein DKX38_025714 [Salix brachista]